MQSARDRLIFLSLCVLDQAVAEATAAPAHPPVAVRLALACLCSLGSGNREAVDGFWNVLTDPMDHQSTDHSRAYVRQTMARTQMTIIARSVGRELGPGIDDRLSAAWRASGEKKEAARS